ncbi:MAG: hypothetical protein HQ518_12450 [Rhodopirellula sp.]|nr:hypothetical protein [Rhodopirellula sp.]
MDVFLPFISLVLLSAGLGIDNGLLIFIICVLLLNDAAQAMIDTATAKRVARTAAQEAFS